MPVIAHDITITARNCKGLPSRPALAHYIKRVADILGTRIVATIGHDFDPWGATHCAVLATSHAIVHTYPEHRLAYVNISSCKPPADPDALRDFTRGVFQTDDVEVDTHEVVAHDELSGPDA